MKCFLPTFSLVIASFATQAQTVVFDTMSLMDPPSSLSAQNNYRFADDATLINPAGETIGQLDFSVGGNYDTTADVYVSLFDATGAGGAPGNTLWSSSPISTFFALYDDFEDVVSVTIPNIPVPQSFFWAIEFRNIVALNDPDGNPPVFPFVGPHVADNSTLQPAGVSTSTSTYYFDVDGANGPASFNPVNVIGADSTLAVKIYNSVPEPAAASLLALGGAGVALLLRRRRRA